MLGAVNDRRRAVDSGQRSPGVHREDGGQRSPGVHWEVVTELHVIAFSGHRAGAPQDFIFVASFFGLGGNRERKSVHPRLCMLSSGGHLDYITIHLE